MEIDRTTLIDLSVFHSDEEQSLLHKLDFTRTVQGRQRLVRMFNKPLKNFDEIIETQRAVKFIGTQVSQWPATISNGSLMVIEKFFVSNIDLIPEKPSGLSMITYKLMSTGDYSLVTFSSGHLTDFIRGMQQFSAMFATAEAPKYIQDLKKQIDNIVERREFEPLKNISNAAELSKPQQISFAHFFRYHFKRQTEELMGIYAHLDAWYSMALAAERHGLSFPELTNLSLIHI